MTSTHPFEWLATKRRALVCWIAWGATALLWSVLLFLNQALVTESAWSGIVDLQFAGSGDFVRAILDDWGSAGRSRAALCLWLDFAFASAIVFAVGLACVLLAPSSESSGFGTALSNAMSWLAVAAGIFDVAENTALLFILGGQGIDFWPPIVWWLAYNKFLLIVLPMIFVAIRLMDLWMRSDIGDGY